jgi:23S rRNA pseudouridine1911/1915/1917 synthase
MDVIYFDNHIIVVNKPSGIPTQPSPYSDVSLEEQVKIWAKGQFKKPGEVFVHAVHRLDKPVSGIVLFAKTSKALERLQWFLREKKMKKTYVALVEGSLLKDEDSLVHFLVHDAFRSIVASPQQEGAKEAKLHYRVQKHFTRGALVEVDLHTGRYHQIRVQFSAIGHPILNDIKYGAKKIGLDADQIALHHAHMEIIHPITKETMTFQAPLPPFWSHWIKQSL